jgi:xanthine dehydrogenase iron-sulfur cluster and FAD-binding subunit A
MMKLTLILPPYFSKLLSLILRRLIQLHHIEEFNAIRQFSNVIQLSAGLNYSEAIAAFCSGVKRLALITTVCIIEVS